MINNETEKEILDAFVKTIREPIVKVLNESAVNLHLDIYRVYRTFYNCYNADMSKSADNEEERQNRAYDTF
ncbi:MAG TPA: hypothetical protein VFE71_06380, partial [Bacteroidales bacterium]|nr:hypothetical protein [Bacteroidales bacterium]